MKKIKKFKKTAKKQFIIAIDEEIDRKVNDALGMVEMGFIDKGAVIIEGLMTHYPDYQTVHFGMGVVHAFREQYDEATRCFKKALDIFPYFIDAQFNLAVSYQKKLDFGNTIEEGNLGTLPILFLPLLFWSAALLWKEISLQYPLQFLY